MGTGDSHMGGLNQSRQNRRLTDGPKAVQNTEIYARACGVCGECNPDIMYLHEAMKAPN